MPAKQAIQMQQSAVQLNYQMMKWMVQSYLSEETNNAFEEVLLWLRQWAQRQSERGWDRWARITRSSPNSTDAFSRMVAVPMVNQSAGYFQEQDRSSSQMVEGLEWPRHQRGREWTICTMLLLAPWNIRIESKHAELGPLPRRVWVNNVGASGWGDMQSTVARVIWINAQDTQ